MAMLLPLPRSVLAGLRQIVLREAKRQHVHRSGAEMPFLLGAEMPYLLSSPAATN
jgi:hypothetical protein